MLKGILFDMDGTLIDSEPVHYRAYEMVLNPMGKHLAWEDYQTFLGTTRPVIRERIQEIFGELPITVEEFERQVGENKDKINGMEGYPLVAGVPEMLARMKAAGYRLAVASSSPQAYVEHVMTTLGLSGYFDLLISGETVANPKPAPDVFLQAAKRLGLAPSECLVVEDSHNGVLAGMAAGMASAAFLNPNSSGQDVGMATVAFRGFEELTPAWAEAAWETFLVKLAAKARLSARVPQSGFHVGAALVARDGHVFTGCNMELERMLTSICAERCALAKAVSEGYQEFEAIAVVSDQADPISPCGICRQYLWDFGEDLKIFLGNADASRILRTTAGELLPLAFRGTEEGLA